MILAVINDLFFQAKIEGAARAEEAVCLALGGEEEIDAVLLEQNPDVLFVDLGVSTLDALALIRKLKHSVSTKDIPLLAFTHHVREDLLREAKEAGADLVLPKSVFNQRLNELIRYYKKTPQK